ncbi:MAG: hypothetical protein Q9208_005003 [Pyrenodesmia sp. 3 TL-2023]
MECLAALHQIPDAYDMDILEKMDLYKDLTRRYTMPELINVVDDEAIWRVPYNPPPGLGPTRYMSEAIAVLLSETSSGRYNVFAIGNHGYEGDVFLKGYLSDDEYQEVMHGRFPRTLSLIGIPGPGLCEAPEQALVVQPISVHPPRAPGGRGHEYGGYGIGYDAPPPLQPHPSQQMTSPNHFGPPHQPRGSRRPGGSFQPGNPRGTGQFTQGPKPSRKFITPVSESSSESDGSSGKEDSDSPPPTARAKAKKVIGKPQKKPPRRQRSPSEDSIGEDLVLTDDEQDGRQLMKRAAKKPTRRVGRSDDEDEAQAPPAPRRPAAHGPPKRGPLDATEVRDFAPAGGESQRKHPQAPKPGRRIGRSDDEAEYPIQPRDQRGAAGPGPPGSGGQRAPIAPGKPARVPGRADARRQERRHQVALEDEKPPELDPAEKARLDALKAANGFGKGGMP